jgi:hypothetical protein
MTESYFTPHKVGWMLYRASSGMGVTMSQKPPEHVPAGFAIAQVDPSIVHCGMTLGAGGWRESTERELDAHHSATLADRNPSPCSFLVAAADLGAAIAMTADFHADNPKWPVGPPETWYPDRLSEAGSEPATYLLCWNRNMFPSLFADYVAYRDGNPKGVAKHGPVASWEWRRHPAGMAREEFLEARGLKLIVPEAIA